MLKSLIKKSNKCSTRHVKYLNQKKCFNNIVSLQNNKEEKKNLGAMSPQL